MARVYATETDLIAYTGQAAPDGAAALLRQASQFLDANVFRVCWYRVGADGLPSHAEVAEAFSDAVCAQVQWWGKVGDSVGADGVGWVTMTAGSVTLSRAGSLGRSGVDITPEASPARQIAPQVWDALDLINHHHFRMGGVTNR